MKEYDKRWKEQENMESGLRTLIDERELQLLKDANKVLDLGCGDGLTLAFLVDKGFDVTGMDYSEVGIANAKKRVSKKAKFVLGDIYQPLPFEDEEFDAIIAYQVINHNTIEEIRKLLKELHRILKPGGVFSVKVSDWTTYGYNYVDGLCYDEFGSILKPIGERTFLPIAGWEKGVIHYDFNKEILKKEVEDAGFELLDMRNIKCHILGNFRKK